VPGGCPLRLSIHTRILLPRCGRDAELAGHIGEQLGIEGMIAYGCRPTVGRAAWHIANSRVNDDHVYYRFYEPVGRFPEIVEDALPLFLLYNDYRRYFRHAI
jgi:hypothetical protein